MKHFLIYEITPNLYSIDEKKTIVAITYDRDIATLIIEALLKKSTSLKKYEIVMTKNFSEGI